MTGINHAFNDPKTDLPGFTGVKPSDWNADHVITGDVSFGGHNLNNVGLINGVSTGQRTSILGIKNVRDYGAKGDGSTDDTIAIQAAINDITSPYSFSSQGIVYFPPGIYKLTSSLTYSAAIGYIAFLGSPGVVTIGDFSGPHFQRDTGSPAHTVVWFKSFRIQNNHATGKGITMAGCIGGTVEDLSIAAHIGIETYGSQSINVDGCDFTQSGNLSGSIGVTAGNATSINSCDFVGYENGIRHQNLGLIMHGGRFENCTVGIMLGKDQNNNNFGSNSVHITGLSMESNLTAIQVQNCQEAVIEGINTTAFTGTIANGIFIQDSFNIVLVGCNFSSGVGYTGAGVNISTGVGTSGTGMGVAMLGVTADTWSVNAASKVDPTAWVQTNYTAANTFSTLPPNPKIGMRTYITDSSVTTWGSNAAGGGSSKVLVWYNGTNWTVVGA